jgi:hypothetical protein
MAIEGLRTVPEQPMLLHISISDHVDANVEALDTLGLVEDREQVTESVARDFEALNNSGRTGETYIALPRGLITLEDLIDVSDSGNYDGKRYPESFVWHPLWTPGNNRGGYKTEELDNLTFSVSDGNFPVHARLAVYGSECEEDPMLHFLNIPYKPEHSAYKRKTQLEAIDNAIAAYEAEGHEGFAMTPLNAKAIAYIGLVRRIKGEPMPLVWGCMHDGTMRDMKTGPGGSEVGSIRFYEDEFNLSATFGYARSDLGVGLSVGPKVLEA